MSKPRVGEQQKTPARRQKTQRGNGRNCERRARVCCLGKGSSSGWHQFGQSSLARALPLPDAAGGANLDDR